MRVLTVHNFYGSEAPSGENTAYLAEIELLKANGIELLEFTRHSDEIRGHGLAGMLRGGLSATWNPVAAAGLRRQVNQFEPDFVHVHNTFPLVSPAIFHALRIERAAVIMTAHNFRVACASAMLSRNGSPCTLCVDKRSVQPALTNRCYRHSFIATLPVAMSIALHRTIGTWRNYVDAFIALTEFQRSMLVRAGIPEDRLHIKGNVYPGPAQPASWERRCDRALFIGRIGPEKGLDVVLEAWRAWGAAAPRLEIIGTGPRLAEERAFVAAHGLDERVCFHGALPFEETQRMLAASRLLVVPSRVFEGYPMVVREAYALGVPVAASDIGSLRTLVEEGVTGVRFPVGEPERLLKSVRTLWSRPLLMRRMADAAHERFLRELAPRPNFARLLEIYASAARVRARRLDSGRRA